MDNRELPKSESRIQGWVEDTYGSLEALLGGWGVPDEYHQTIDEVLVIRSEFGFSLAPFEETNFQSRASQVYLEHNIPIYTALPIHSMVVEVAQLWSQGIIRSN